MKIFLLSLLFILYTSYCFPQESISFDLFTAKIENAVLKVSDPMGNSLYEEQFTNPHTINYDLDDDGLSELMVLDSSEVNGRPLFKIFIYNTVDSFYLADSILSGSYEPYEFSSEETGSTIIIAGNPAFDQYNLANDFIFLPVDCWRYEDGNIYSVNDEVYDIFLTENEGIIDFLEDYYTSNIKNCTSAEEVKPAIISAYVNFLNAGEKSIASQFIKKYYLCTDLDQVINEVNSLSLKKDN